MHHSLSLCPNLLLSQLKITNTKQQFLFKIVVFVWTEVAESISTQNSDDLFLLRNKLFFLGGGGEEGGGKGQESLYYLFVSLAISKIHCEIQPKTRTENLVKNSS